MRKLTLVTALAMCVLVCCAQAFAMTGIPVNGEPADNQIGLTDLSQFVVTHDETVGNPLGWYKGWWWATVTNNTASPWSTVSIESAGSDLVAIVQGNGLADEWGFVGNSVVANRPAIYTYIGALGGRTYENGATGLLWDKVSVSFATPVAANGGKVSFKVYTDNSYYTGPWASSFGLVITPNAVPEPSSLLALSGSLLGLAGFAWRKRK